jgi:hypothetical protein
MALEAERAWFGRLCTTYAKHSPASDKNVQTIDDNRNKINDCSKMAQSLFEKK